MRSTAFVLLLLASSAPATADWLVAGDGSRIETRGPWQVQKSLVLFTTSSGTLSSMRLSEVDLAASGEATEATVAAATAPSKTTRAPGREPVLVLDHRNIPPAAVPTAEESTDRPRSGEEAETTEPAARSDSSTKSGPVEVVFWQERAHPDLTGIEIHGTLRNFSSQIATRLGLTVRLLDTSGQTIRTAQAFIDTPSLAARSTTTFRALFSDFVGLEAEPRFQVASQVLEFPSQPDASKQP